MKKVIGIIGAVILAVSFTACSSSSTSTTTTTKVDAANAFGQAHGADVQALVNDMQFFATDAQNEDVKAIYSDCQSIVYNAKILQADGPINDLALEAQWSTALSSLVSGANACTLGIDSGSPELIQQAGNDFTNALDAIKQMIQIKSS